jgi:hypothetical protein
MEGPRLLWIIPSADGRLLAEVRDLMGVFDQASIYSVQLNLASFFAWRVPRFAAALNSWAVWTYVRSLSLLNPT